MKLLIAAIATAAFCFGQMGSTGVRAKDRGGWSDDGTTVQTPAGRKVQLNGDTKVTGNLAISTTCPGGAPAGSVCIAGTYYANGIPISSSTAGLPFVNPTLPPYNLKADGSNNLAAMNQLLADMTSGARIVFPIGKFSFAGCLVIPHRSADYIQPSFVIEGATVASNGVDWNPNLAWPAEVGTTLQFSNCTAANGVIETTGFGTLEIHHVNLQDATSTDTLPLIYTTRTTLQIHNNTFSCLGSQDAIQLGSGVAGDSYGFFGYGTRIRDNFFTGCRQNVYARNFANAILIEGNVVYGHYSGAPFYAGPAIHVNGGTGVTIRDNLLELPSYQWGVQLENTEEVVADGNGCWDSGASTLACYRIESTAKNTYARCGFYDSVKCVDDQGQNTDAGDPKATVGTRASYNATTGYKVNGSYGTNGQCLTSTGTGSQWSTCTAASNYPLVVANLSLAGQTAASGGLQPFYTVPAGGGMYRVTVTLFITGAGTGTSLTVSAGANGGTLCTGGAVGVTVPSGAAGGISNCSFVSWIPANSSAFYGVTFNGITSAPTYSVYGTVERLQ